MPSWNQRAQLFRTMPLPSAVAFLTGVGCLFAAINAAQDAIQVDGMNQPRLLFTSVSGGVAAVLWAYLFATRRIKSLIALLTLQISVSIALGRYWPQKHQAFTPDQLRSELILHHVVIMILVVLGYLLLSSFFGMEGSRFFAAHTEIQLAGEIQKQLVPPIEESAAGWEFYGTSIPSGAVGGDLLDVVVSGESFCAYVADVAGHGVSAGVLMSMVKSAVRMRLASLGSFRDGLPPLNDVLHGLTSDASFVTFAYITGDGSRRLTFSLAAHPPIFHCPHLSKRVDRHSVENLPLGMFGRTSYKTAQIECGPGDILAIVTDGLVEVFDRQDRDIGSEYIEKILIDAAAEPLRAVAQRIMETSQAFGKITDDRTVLLMRCL
jgi:hypothetical protein